MICNELTDQLFLTNDHFLSYMKNEEVVHLIWRENDVAFCVKLETCY